MEASFELLAALLPDDDLGGRGYSEAELVEKEAELGFRLPELLRIYYIQYGKCRYITQDCHNHYEPLPVQDFFMPGEDFFTTEKDYLVFYQCKESVIYCGIKRSDLQLADPPVYSCAWDNDRWYLENNSLGNFLLYKAIIQIAMEGRLSYWVYFNESMWNLSEYRLAWQIDENGLEVVETTPKPAWRLFIKEKVLIVFESALDGDDDSILGVSLVSSDKESLQNMLLRNTPAGELPDYQTNM